MDARPKDPVEKNPKRGGVLVLVAIAMVALLGFLALVVDVGWALVNRNSLQNISDGAALAATRELGHMYQQIDPADQVTFTCYDACAERIREVAKDVAWKNRAGNVNISLADEDIRIGQWHEGTFTETGDQPDAVEVTSRRVEGLNTPVPTFFARVLGIESTPVSALATAAMTGQGTTEEGELVIPVTLSSWFWEEDNPCNEYIRFNPTNDPRSCGGWTTFFTTPSSVPPMRDLLDEVVETPEVIAHQDTIVLFGGNMATVFDNMLTMFKRNGCATTNTGTLGSEDFRPYLSEEDVAFRAAAEAAEVFVEDGCVDWREVQHHPQAVEWEEPDNQGVMVQGEYPDGTLRYYHKWETTVPVYDRDDCSNPNQTELVVGFTSVIITDVSGPSLQQIDGLVVCDRISEEDNRGGGGEFGLKGPIPGLVR
jgi:Flp pilus assembly protein TadG